MSRGGELTVKSRELGQKCTHMSDTLPSCYRDAAQEVVYDRLVYSLIVQYVLRAWTGTLSPYRRQIQ